MTASVHKGVSIHFWLTSIPLSWGVFDISPSLDMLPFKKLVAVHHVHA